MCFWSSQAGSFTSLIRYISNGGWKEIMMSGVNECRRPRLKRAPQTILSVWFYLQTPEGRKKQNKKKPQQSLFTPSFLCFDAACTRKTHHVCNNRQMGLRGCMMGCPTKIASAVLCLLLSRLPCSHERVQRRYKRSYGAIQTQSGRGDKKNSEKYIYIDVYRCSCWIIQPQGWCLYTLSPERRKIAPVRPLGGV